MEVDYQSNPFSVLTLPESGYESDCSFCTYDYTYEQAIRGDKYRRGKNKYRGDKYAHVNILDLPNELLRMIFDHVGGDNDDDTQQMCNLTKICGRFRDVIGEYALFHKYCLETFEYIWKSFVDKYNDIYKIFGNRHGYFDNGNWWNIIIQNDVEIYLYIAHHCPELMKHVIPDHPNKERVKTHNTIETVQKFLKISSPYSQNIATFDKLLLELSNKVYDPYYNSDVYLSHHTSYIYPRTLYSWVKNNYYRYVYTPQRIREFYILLHNNHKIFIESISFYKALSELPNQLKDGIISLKPSTLFFDDLYKFSKVNWYHEAYKAKYKNTAYRTLNYNDPGGEFWKFHESLKRKNVKLFDRYTKNTIDWHFERVMIERSYKEKVQQPEEITFFKTVYRRINFEDSEQEARDLGNVSFGNVSFGNVGFGNISNERREKEHPRQPKLPKNIKRNKSKRKKRNGR